MKRTIWIVLIVLAVAFIIMKYNINTEFEAVINERETMYEAFNLIDIINFDEQKVVLYEAQPKYSNDKMYSAEIVEKGLFNYHWIFGVGHINREIGIDENFDFSIQLLDEDIDNPIALGIVKNQEIRSIQLMVMGEAINAKMYNTDSETERMLIFLLDKPLQSDVLKTFEITYMSGKKIIYSLDLGEVEKSSTSPHVSYIRL